MSASPPRSNATPSENPEDPEPEPRGGVSTAPADPLEGKRLFTPPFLRLLAMQAAYGFSFSMFFLLPKYLASVGEPAARIGFVMAGFGVACILTIPFLRGIVETLGRRGTLIAASMLQASAAALFGMFDRHGQQA